MRIIAGQWRGRSIEAPPGQNTRPILDRTKTVLFDMLGHRLARPGQLPPIAVLDLYAGSGSIGLEALSRGARFGLFVERHRPTAALLRRNLETLQVPADQGQVLCGSVDAGQLPAPPADPETGEDGRYELIFIDPPYKLMVGPKPHGEVTRLLHRLTEWPVIAPDALIVMRQPFQHDGGPALSPLIEQSRKDCGTMTFRFLNLPAGPGEVSS